jgi:hypothetical protein
MEQANLTEACGKLAALPVAEVLQEPVLENAKLGDKKIIGRQTNQFTVSFWMYVHGFQMVGIDRSPMPILSSEASSRGTSFASLLLGVQRAKECEAKLMLYPGSNLVSADQESYDASPCNLLVDGNWHHYCMAYDVSGKNLSWYVDGALSASSTFVGARSCHAKSHHGGE